MDRYIVDLLLNEDNSPFNSKNFRLLYTTLHHLYKTEAG